MPSRTTLAGFRPVMAMQMKNCITMIKVWNWKKTKDIFQLWLFACHFSTIPESHVPRHPTPRAPPLSPCPVLYGTYRSKIYQFKFQVFWLACKLIILFIMLISSTRLPSLLLTCTTCAVIIVSIPYEWTCYQTMRVLLWFFTSPCII